MGAAACFWARAAAICRACRSAFASATMRKARALVGSDCAATSPARGLASSASSAPRGSDSIAAIDPGRGPIPKRCSASAATAFADALMTNAPTPGDTVLMANAFEYSDCCYPNTGLESTSTVRRRQPRAAHRSPDRIAPTWPAARCRAPAGALVQFGPTPARWSNPKPLNCKALARGSTVDGGQFCDAAIAAVVGRIGLWAVLEPTSHRHGSPRTKRGEAAVI